MTKDIFGKEIPTFGELHNGTTLPPLPKVTHLEIIDHRDCTTCGGKGYTLSGICDMCAGNMILGRILTKHNISLKLDLQDDGRTLKVFLEEKQ